MMAALLGNLSGLTISDGQINRLQTKYNDPKTAETCRRLGNACASLFVFAAYDGVSPTNNIAEQTIHKAVIFRKLSFSTEEQTGSLNLSSSSQQLRPADAFKTNHIIHLTLTVFVP
jgi:hypothetical protein